MSFGLREWRAAFAQRSNHASPNLAEVLPVAQPAGMTLILLVDSSVIRAVGDAGGTRAGEGREIHRAGLSGEFFPDRGGARNINL
jgi:hypothetical protein